MFSDRNSMLLPLLAGLVPGLLAAPPVHAHHNPTSHYLIDEMITVEGVVTEFRLINPHARIYFDVTGADDEVQHWFAEGNAAGILKRRGWDKDTLKPGTVIRISGYPARDGGHKLDWKLIELEDGTVLRGGNTVGVEKDLLLEDIDRRRELEQDEDSSDPGQPRSGDGT